MSAAQVKKIKETVATFAPLPVTQRGFGIHLHGTTKGEARLAYGNGPNVVIRYLDDETRADVFNGHKSNVNVAKFSPNGEWVASGDATGVVIVWGSKGDHIIKNTVRCCQGILDIQWSGDGKRIMAGGDGGGGFFGKVFNWDSSNAIGQITNNSKKLLSVAFKPSRPFKIATVSEEKQMCFYEGPPFKFVKSDRTHTNYPNCVRFNPEGSLFATCGSDRKIVIYDGTSGDKVKEFPEKHTGSIYELDWSPDGNQILTCAGDKTAIIWNVADGSVATEFKIGNGIGDMQVSCLWLGDDIITVSLSGDINFLDTANPGQPKKVWSGHQAAIDSIAITPDGKQIFSGDRTGRICVTESKSGEREAFSGTGHQGDQEDKGNAVAKLAVSADGTKLLSAGHDDKLYVSDIASKKTSDQWMALEGQPRCLAAANTDASLAVVGTSRGVLHVVENGKEKKRILLGFEPTCVTFSADDAEICVGAGGKTKKAVIYARSGFDFTQSTEIELEIMSPLTCIAYSDDGEHLTIGDTERHVFVFKRPSNELVNKTGWRYHQAKITALAWTKNSQMLLSASSDEMVIAWPKAAEGKPHKRIKIDPTHLQGVLDLKVLDEQHYVTVGTDRYIRVWAVPSI